MSEQDAAAVVKRGYEAFQRGDIQTVLDLMADDVVWETPTVAGIRYGGRREGKQGVASFFSDLQNDEEVLLFEPREFITQGERVAVLGRYRGRVRATDRIFESDFVQLFTVRNGKLSKFLELYDTAVVEHAFQRAASA